MVIRFSESALRDLEEVRAWYAEQQGVGAGANLVEDVFQRVQVLAGHPDMGRVVSEFDQSFLRELIRPPFRLVYRRDPKWVSVVRFWRSEHLQQLSAAE